MPKAEPWTNVEGDPTTFDRISVSEIGSFNRCARKHSYAYRQGLKPADTPGYFTKGKYLHAVLAEAYKSAGTEVLYPQLVQRALVAMQEVEEGKPVPELPTPEDQAGIDKVLMPWLRAGFAEISKYEVLGVEAEFYVDLGWRNAEGEPVLLYGFIDAPVRHEGQVWLLEHKSAGKAWSQGQFLFDYQTRLYTAALRALGIVGGSASGTVFQFFYPNRTESKVVYSTPEEEARLIAEIQGVIDARDFGLVTRQPHWGCNDCGFKAICHAELIGGDADYIRATQYTVDQDKVDRFSEEG